MASKTGVENATAEAISGVEGAVEEGRGLLTGAKTGAGEALKTGLDTGKEAIEGVYGTSKENLDPYLALGKLTTEQLQGLLGEGGEFNRRFSMADYQEDPGYQFRLQEGQKALERSASARGNLLGGGTLKALGRYSQGMASQEYQNAFDRFQGENAARFGRLSTATGIGLNAAGQANEMGKWYGTNLGDLGKWYGSSGADLEKWYGGAASSNLMTGANLTGDYRMRGATTGGQFLMGGTSEAAQLRFRAAQDAANALMGKGNAEAAGDIAGGNAWAQGISGAGGSIMDAVLLSKLLKPQAPPPSGNQAYSYLPSTP
jgi:hypothetical protein